MIWNLRNLLRITHNYTNPIDRQQATGLFALLWAGLLLSIVSSVIFILPNVITGNAEPGSLFFLIGSPLIVGFVLQLVRTGRLRAASILTVLSLVPIIFILLPQEGIDSPYLVLLTLPLVVAGLLLNRRGYVLTVAFVALGVIISGLAEFDSLTEMLVEADLAGPLLFLASAVMILYVFSGRAYDVVEENLRDLAQFQAIGRFASSIEHTDETAVLAGALNLLRGELDYDFAQMYLKDDSGRLTRRLRTGLGLPETGVITTVNVTDASALNEVVNTGRTVLLDSDDNINRRVHFLPSTGYGIAIPVMLNDQVIGVLDVQQSSQPFSDTNIIALRTLAEQVGAIIADTRLIVGLRESVDAQEVSISSLRSQLREYRQVERQRITGLWGEYIEKRNRAAIGFDLETSPTGLTLNPADDLPEVVVTAMQAGQTVVREEGDAQLLQVPIQVRGELLGAMTFRLPITQEVTERQIDFAQSVTARLALALENKRLFEQSQAQAERERKANEVAGLLIGATEVNEVLTLAAERFKDALGAIGTRIHIESDALKPRLAEPPPDSNGRHDGEVKS
ncbi:MAG: GAF domain-containing protein [Chloroflexota bacterium]